MTVKFIQTRDGRIVFGKRSAEGDLHVKVAEENGISEDEVVGGGWADMEAKRIFGTSTWFGPYDREVVKAALPEWEVG